MPGERCPSGQSRCGRVLVVAVVAVQRLGHEVAGAANPGRGEDRLVLRARVVHVDPDRHERAHRELVVRDRRPSTAPPRRRRRRRSASPRGEHASSCGAMSSMSWARTSAPGARRPVPYEVDELLHAAEASSRSLQSSDRVDIDTSLRATKASARSRDLVGLVEVVGHQARRALASGRARVGEPVDALRSWRRWPGGSSRPDRARGRRGWS